MNKELLDLSGKIDAEIVDVISAVSASASSLSIRFFLVGALARDLLFKHHNIPLRRSTLDVDLAIQVSSWAQHQKLIDDLIRHRQFLRTEKVYRLKLEETLVDIIPFGDVADENLKIAYPPDHRTIMSVVGFQEAFDSSVNVRISSDPNVDIKVSSLAGVAILKLIAWDEKYPERDKDAEDLLLIMDRYEELGQFDRLYDEEPDL